MAGRKGAYETRIKPRFQEIKAWVENGATEKQIAEQLDVSYSCFNKYKAEKKEFEEILKKGRVKLVEDLKGALIKKALGFKETTTKHYEKTEDGKVTSYTEINEQYYPPDVAAINLALKNYDREDWSNDWQHYNLKKEELELKKKLAEQNMW